MLLYVVEFVVEFANAVVVEFILQFANDVAIDIINTIATFACKLFML